jgi:hypothetical protein
MNWKKVNIHRHLSEDGRFELVRRKVFGGNTWQIFCLGNHEKHEKCPGWALASSVKIETTKKIFEDILEDPDRKEYWNI